MNLEPRMLKLVNRFYKPERDPRRADATWRAFDEGRHYGEYLARCRAQFRRSPVPRADADLEARGFTWLRALAAERASGVAADLESPPGAREGDPGLCPVARSGCLPIRRL